MYRPLVKQKLQTADGEMWVVKHVVEDVLNPGNFLILLVPVGKENDWLVEPIEVYQDQWDSWCFSRGVTFLLPEPENNAEPYRGG